MQRDPLVIERDVPIPANLENARVMAPSTAILPRSILYAMQVNDSVLIPTPTRYDAKKVMSAINNFRPKRPTWKFVMHRTTQATRVWRIE